MNRRQFLAGALVGLGSLAGCNTADRGTPTLTPAPVAETEASGPVRERVGEVALPVPRGELRTAVPRDQIPAIVDPAFGEDWAGLSVPDGSGYDGGPLLPDSSPVIGVEADGEARAYPLRILDWHEVVNDAFGGPLLVSYCVLCGSAVVTERRVDGEVTTFGVSGQLWRSDLVLYDRATDSRWSQLLATAIRGPRTGEQLTLRPSSLTTWAEWQDRHPDTLVLLPPPRSGRIADRGRNVDYFTDKYSYDGDPLVGYERTVERVLPRTLVVGVTVDGEARAYPYGTVAEADVVNDTLAGTPLLVTTTPGNSLAAYDRRLGGRTLTFEPDDERHVRAGGSAWERATGVAVDGPYAGEQLTRANDIPPLFWLGWSNFNPGSSVYGE